MLPNWLYGKSKSKLASILGGGTSYSAGTGINITNNVISIAEPITATLTAGSTSITIRNSAITANSFLLPIVSVWGIAPATVTPAEGSVTMTFAAQANDITVGVMLLSQEV